MRIYIARSTFEIYMEKESKFVEVSLELNRLLIEAGHVVIHTDEDKWIPYPEIQALIETCGCLIGFIDDITLASTWRAMEITYAHCGMGAFENTGFHIPVFFYKGLENKQYPFIESMIKQDDVYVLPNDLKEAVKFLENTMANKIKK